VRHVYVGYLLQQAMINLDELRRYRQRKNYEIEVVWG